jgi:hypothetical protein
LSPACFPSAVSRAGVVVRIVLSSERALVEERAR